MGSTAPVTNEASSEARKSAPYAISLASPPRPSGVRSMSAAVDLRLGLRHLGEDQPWADAVDPNRIPREVDRCRAGHLHDRSLARLIGEIPLHAAEAVDRCRVDDRAGALAAHRRHDGPHPEHDAGLVDGHDASHSSSGASPTPAKATMPALLTRTSIGPSAASAPPATRRQSSALATSRCR